MALEKVKSTVYGVDGNYWKVIEVTINLMQPYALIKVALFKDQATRQSGAQPLEIKAYDINSDLEVFPLLADELEAQGVNVYQAIYAYLKTLPEFAGALDV